MQDRSVSLPRSLIRATRRWRLASGVLALTALLGPAALAAPPPPNGTPPAETANPPAAPAQQATQAPQTTQTTREAGPLGQDFIQPLDPLQLDRPLLAFLAEPTKTLVPLRNLTDKPVEFSKPAVTSFRRAGSGDVALGVALSRPLTVETAGSSQPVTRLAPHAAVDYWLTLPADFTPGKYTLTLLSAGAGASGGVATRTLDISVRASWVIALVLFLAGAIAGHLITQWRARGRLIVDHLIGLATLREQLAAIERDAIPEPAAEPLDSVRRALANIETHARGGGDVAGELATAGDKVAALRNYVILLRKSASTDAFPGDTRPQRCEEIARAFAAETFQPSAMGALLEKFADDVKNAPALAIVVGQAEALADACRARLDAQPDVAALNEMRAPLSQLENDLRRPADADGALERRRKIETSYAALQSAADRAAESWRAALASAAASSARKDEAEAALKSVPRPTYARDFDKLTQASEKLDELSGKPPATRTQAETLEQLPGGLPSLPIGVDPGYIPLPTDMSLSALQAYRAKWQFWTNVVALGLIGLAGVWALWLNNPIWGSLADMFTAVLTGAATRLVVGEARQPTQ